VGTFVVVRATGPGHTHNGVPQSSHTVRDDTTPPCVSRVTVMFSCGYGILTSRHFLSSPVRLLSCQWLVFYSPHLQHTHVPLTRCL
jgi:hypothetical protein